ncbi:hypothetical protein IFM89_003378 [Coptis chinensis]|uniref:Neprosin PEP catalytic domain-containing protein n=1 Tax=Coptis chinensis TaxID=261450 RepID=A0A835M8H6_9MAGN|nr:hypothetical protein IFM89_003378 [Coptis chinensis]
MAMVSKVLITVLFLVCFGRSNYGVHGGRSIPGEEDLELENQLKVLNKPPIKTIKVITDWELIVSLGVIRSLLIVHTVIFFSFAQINQAIYDCIDVHRQPALDHPLLKNHKIQRRPTFFPEKLELKPLAPAKHKTILPVAINCPARTVPIRRTQKEDLTRAKFFSEMFTTDTHPLTWITPGKHLAVHRSIPNPNITYKGIEAHINVYAPTAKKGQTSSAQMWIENGAPQIRNSLQAGWMVAPDLFGDARAHLFGYWSVRSLAHPQVQVPNGVQRGCFNHLCQGFVQTNQQYSLGVPFNNGSTYGDNNQMEIHLMIYQDPINWNWWLTIPERNVTIGYWPAEIIPNLRQGASIIAWGGQAIGLPNGFSPEMGSGHFPDGNYRHGCYFRQIHFVNATNVLEKPYLNMATFVDNNNCYDVKYDGIALNPDFNYGFVFGGPGGWCGR